MAQALVVVVNRHGKNSLGEILADHILVENAADFARGRQFGAIGERCLGR